MKKGFVLIKLIIVAVILAIIDALRLHPGGALVNINTSGQ